MRLLIVCLLLPLSAIGQEPVLADLVSDPFNEVYQPEVSVSGNVIIGVMTAAAAQAIVADRLAIGGISADGAGDVCLRVASSDGIYTSKNQYRVPGRPGEIVRLPYASKISDVVERYADGQIAVSATSGDCDSGSSIYHLVTASGGAADDDVVIYLNSFGATDVFYEVLSDEAGGGAEACEYISEGRRTTYDYFCRIGGSKVGDGADIAIYRERFGREQPTVELKVIGVAQ